MTTTEKRLSPPADRSASTPSGSGAVIHLGPVPDELMDELPGLYSSLRSTRAWFAAFDPKQPDGVCILSKPRHVLMLHLDDDRVSVMNRGIKISPEDARRTCAAVFSSVSKARRIRIEVPFPPEELGLPTRVMDVVHPLVIDLPHTVEEYYASLGHRTRKNLRNFQNRLRSSHPDVETAICAPDAVAMAGLVEQFADWNIVRMRSQGRVSGFEKDRARVAKVALLMIQGRARALMTRIDGRLAAVEFIHHVGDAATIYAGSFNHQYADLHLGFLSTYWAVCETIREGARRCDLLWTGDYYKGLFGARPVIANRLSVFRTKRARLLALDEVGQITWRRSKERIRSVLRIP